MLDIYTIQDISKTDERDRQGFPMLSDAENVLKIDRSRTQEEEWWEGILKAKCWKPHVNSELHGRGKESDLGMDSAGSVQDLSTICWWQHSNPLVLFLTLLLDSLLWVESFSSGSTGHSEPWLQAQRIILPVHRDWLKTFLWSQLKKKESRIMADPISRHTFSPAKSELWRHSPRFANRHHFPWCLERRQSGEQGHGEVVLVAPSPWNWHILI